MNFSASAFTEELRKIPERLFFCRTEGPFSMQTTVSKQEKVLQDESSDLPGIHSAVLKELRNEASERMIAVPGNTMLKSGVFLVRGLVGREQMLIFKYGSRGVSICLTLLLGESIEIIIKNTITGYVGKYNMLGGVEISIKKGHYSAGVLSQHQRSCKQGNI